GQCQKNGGHGPPYAKATRSHREKVRLRLLRRLRLLAMTIFFVFCSGGREDAGGFTPRTGRGAKKWDLVRAGELDGKCWWLLDLGMGPSRI
ncbi:MAG: hypothetical protein JXD22_08440, partial [Sedimentisphaerales bacterium]|nr:hypothetical protein [Sedimentisphaerales bacterium]